MSISIPYRSYSNFFALSYAVRQLVFQSLIGLILTGQGNLVRAFEKEFQSLIGLILTLRKDDAFLNAPLFQSLIGLILTPSGEPFFSFS